MSFHIVSAAKPRLNRSELAVPGSRPELFEKAAKSAADVIFLDLEDAVAPDDKEQARKNIIQALNDIDWTGKVMSVRINGLDTEYWYRDVVDLLENCGDRLDQIMIPKAGNAKDIYAVDAVVSAIEAAKGRARRIGFEVIIETAAGLAHVEEIAASSPRMQAMSLGAADYAAYQETVAAFADANGLPYIDLSSYPWTTAEFYDFLHVNSAGIAIINRLLADGLVEVSG